jgi:phosphoenolpyruvate carboxylase
MSPEHSASLRFMPLFETLIDLGNAFHVLD